MKIELKANKKGEIKIIISHSDLDGVGCIIIAKAKFGDDLNWFCCEYNNVNERVLEVLNYLTKENIDLELVEFYITDLSVNNDVAEKLNNYYMNGLNVCLLDHHKTALHLNNYPWAFVVADGTHCGTSLIYYQLERPSYQNVSYADFVKIVKDHDLWIKDEERSTLLNRLFFIYGRDMFIERFSKPCEDFFNEIEIVLLDLDIKAEERYFEKISKNVKSFKDTKGRSFGIAIVERYISSIGHRLIEEKDFDYVVLLDPNNQKVSLRSKSYIDVSEIAESLDGGGHKNASGFPQDYSYVYEFIADKLGRKDK